MCSDSGTHCFESGFLSGVLAVCTSLNESAPAHCSGPTRPQHGLSTGHGSRWLGLGAVYTLGCDLRCLGRSLESFWKRHKVHS